MIDQPHVYFALDEDEEDAKLETISEVISILEQEYKNAISIQLNQGKTDQKNVISINLPLHELILNCLE